MKKLVIANWKMNPQTLEEARKLFASWEHRMHLIKNVEAVVCPPFLFLPALSHYAHNLKLGGQNMSWEEHGPLTGEVSPVHLKMFNVKYVILGHSERRLFFGETDETVVLKLRTALNQKITPIVCLGGEKDAREEDMKELVSKQLSAINKKIHYKYLHKIVFVYEPIWAISTMKNSKPDTPEHAIELIGHIQNLLERHLESKEKAMMIRILYGGTVNKNNVHEFAKYPEIDGALVGAASLDSQNFWEVIKEFDRENIYRS